MKKLVAILILLLAVETYGVYGRHQADRIIYSCEMELGPLCFSWQENALGKLIDDDDDELEEKFQKMKKVWDEDFIDGLARSFGKKNSLEKALENVKDAFEKAGDAVKEAFEK